MSTSHSACLAALQHRFGEQFSQGLSQREQHCHTTTWIKQQLPDAVVFARSTEDVQDLVKICAAHQCPIVPFGVGSSLEGQLNAPQGGVSVDLSGMDQILEVHQEDLAVTLQPGVTREALNHYLRDTGLFFPIDPGANASLGGMVATRASGTNAVRYGTIRENVLSLKVVTADGQLIRTSSRAKKSAAGYDLTHLMIGSEGTLGIITEITLKLHGIPEQITAGQCTFDSVTAACQAVTQVIQLGLPLARMELLDALQVKACNQYSGLSLPEMPLLLLEFHGSSTAVAEQVEMFSQIAMDHGGSAPVFAKTTEERNQLWKARHDAYWASRALRPGCQAHTTDACVPISRLAECVTQTQEDLEASGLVAPIVGHVGDGNFHALLLVDEQNPDELARAKAAVSRIAKRAIEMGGTCTGEHGVGQGKRDYLDLEHGAGVGLMQAIKRALDPNNLFNPGKL